ncbi:hypothetical protein ACIQMJ_19125 [Actinosynnema sp. NPDC091369]
MEIQRHPEVLDQAALAPTRSSSIVAAPADRHGSPHRVEDDRRLQECFARIDPRIHRGGDTRRTRWTGRTRGVPGRIAIEDE